MKTQVYLLTWVSFKFSILLLKIKKMAEFYKMYKTYCIFIDEYTDKAFKETFKITKYQ